MLGDGGSCPPTWLSSAWASPRVDLAVAAGLKVENGVVVDEHLSPAPRRVRPRRHRLGLERSLRHAPAGRALGQRPRPGPDRGRQRRGERGAYTRLPYFFSDQYDLGMEYVGYGRTDNELVVRGSWDREALVFWLHDGVVDAAMNVDVGRGRGPQGHRGRGPAVDPRAGRSAGASRGPLAKLGSPPDGAIRPGGQMSQLATIDRRAATWGVLAVVVALAIAVLGSGNLRWFDAALVGYLFGTLFAIFGVVYRYLVWLRRPPTARLNRRGWEAFRRRGTGAATSSRCRHSSSQPAVAVVHPGPVPQPVARPPARVLGLHPGRARHVPARVRAAALRVGRPERP